MILDTLAAEARQRVARRQRERSLPSLRADAEALVASVRRDSDILIKNFGYKEDEI